MLDTEHIGHLGTESPESALPARRLSELAEQAVRCTSDCCGASTTISNGGTERPAAVTHPDLAGLVSVQLNSGEGPIPVAVDGGETVETGDLLARLGGFTVIGAFKHPAANRTPHYAGYELAARYVDVEDDAVTLESHQVQAGGTYFVTPQLRVQSNVLIPIGDDQPRHSVRWWSRLQFNF